MSEPRLKLISADKGQALTVLLGPLDDAELPEDIRRAAGAMRFRLGSHLAGTPGGGGRRSFTRPPAPGKDAGAQRPKP
ncbi:hypothetical protein HET69_34350 [Streptomyces sp. CJ_13]|uniref:hypothetical protein n=1 Tax=Streptomyces sp. CJ_13 TaxID=2724943 RepID=UPI001BDD3216|nr:hypothetical protein [Streptomyces sp. CJ_13]MBT1188933.1 hypothetical protein [Streptomyces sp. CJ_13]